MENKGNRYTKKVDQRFLDDLKYIRDNNLVDPTDWGLFQSQLQKEFEDLDENWEEISRKTEYEPLSTYGYRKKYVHSIPLRFKQQRQWEVKKADFRIIFKVHEEAKEIYYLGIGKRIKGLPKNPDDVWARMKDIELPEQQ